MSDNEDFCMQVHGSEAVLHRCGQKNCKVVKSWSDHAQKSKGYMGYVRPVDWKSANKQEGSYRRCSTCFPSNPPRGKKALNVAEYRRFLKEKLSFYRRYHTHALGGQDTWGKIPAAKLTQEFANTARSIGDDITRQYDAKHARSIDDYWLMLAVTRELYQQFLGRYASLDAKTYKLLRTEMQKGLKQLYHVQVLAKEGGLDPRWLENSLPTQKQLKDYDACTKLNEEISRGLAVLGFIPCNGNNHPFFCFCGFGGTRLSGE